MNATGFSDDYNATFVGNESLDRSNINNTGSFDNEYYDADKSWIRFNTILRLSYVIPFVAAAVGIPGNILSAIVWLRLHVTTKNSSAVYLAVLAINDLVWLLCGSPRKMIHWLHPPPSNALYNWSVRYVTTCTATFEPLLVLSFSIERLIAVVRPLQVCRLRYTVSYCLSHVVIKFVSKGDKSKT